MSAYPYKPPFRVDPNAEHSCCNEARVIDADGTPVCECINLEDAEWIAAALNAPAHVGCPRCGAEFEAPT